MPVSILFLAVWQPYTELLCLIDRSEPRAEIEFSMSIPTSIQVNMNTMERLVLGRCSLDESHTQGWDVKSAVRMSKVNGLNAKPTLLF